ncbi:MAG: 4a-hydroxytetrahydrobiopterin dehydratase [Deltaproteobacteria bacterium]|nr:4a-hydroxytetrahydrobiopterin dehydratase [Deltaproteobacteria bacterium]
MKLAEKKCVPCEGGTSKLEGPQIQSYLKQISQWKDVGDKIQKVFKFKNFIQAVGFVHQLAIVAEEEGHHPDFCVHYNQITITIWTHAISGLSENDFILAAKIDAIR